MRPEESGLLRASLPSANATRVSDGEFSGGLLESCYIVQAPEGGMFVDFFALFFFKQKTAYEVHRYWSSDVCSSDLARSSAWSSGSQKKTATGRLGLRQVDAR